jgi:regulator of replication initiation timing
MLVTITQASRLVGKARKTIYAHAKSGKVSLSKFGDGRTAIDTSELHRVYGSFKEDVTPEPLQRKNNVTDGNTVFDVLNELKKENALMREEMQKLRGEIKNLNNRLEHKPLPDAPASKDAVKSPGLRKPTPSEPGWQSSLMAKLKQKQKESLAKK